MCQVPRKALEIQIPLLPILLVGIKYMDAINMVFVWYQINAQILFRSGPILDLCWSWGPRGHGEWIFLGVYTLWQCLFSVVSDSLYTLHHANLVRSTLDHQERRVGQLFKLAAAICNQAQGCSFCYCPGCLTAFSSHAVEWESWKSIGCFGVRLAFSIDTASPITRGKALGGGCLLHL